MLDHKCECMNSESSVLTKTINGTNEMLSAEKSYLDWKQSTFNSIKKISVAKISFGMALPLVWDRCNRPFHTFNLLHKLFKVTKTKFQEIHFLLPSILRWWYGGTLTCTQTYICTCVYEYISFGCCFDLDYCDWWRLNIECVQIVCRGQHKNEMPDNDAIKLFSKRILVCAWRWVCGVYSNHLVSCISKAFGFDSNRWRCEERNEDESMQIRKSFACHLVDVARDPTKSNYVKKILLVMLQTHWINQLWSDATVTTRTHTHRICMEDGWLSLTYASFRN